MDVLDADYLGVLGISRFSGFVRLARAVGVPRCDELVGAPPVVENGEFVLPTRPGWGVEVNEAAVRARPPKS